MAVDFSSLSLSHDLRKENRRHTMATPNREKTRSGHGQPNVLNSKFKNLPDPLRCHPTVGLQFHEINMADPNFTAFTRRLDMPEYANRRLSLSGSAVPDARQGPTHPLSLTDPMSPQPEAVGIALSTSRNERISFIGNLPAIFITDADKVGKDGEGHGYKYNGKNKYSYFDDSFEAGSPPATRDSNASTRSVGSQMKLGWQTQNPLTKSHTTLGIDVALKSVETKYNTENISPYYSSPARLNPRIPTFRMEDDAPSIKIPSCSGLPSGWDSVHDRCIAYLSTHAPLTKNGKIPVNETTVERYTIQQISEFLIAKFAQFRSHKKIPHWAIEKRLQMLDLNENEYFRVPYGGYRFEDWGREI